MSFIEQLQGDLLSPKVPLTDTLRKAKVLARQLRSKDLDKWVSQELDGYKTKNDLPDYRIILSSLVGKCTNGFYLISNQSVPLLNIAEDLRKELTTFYIFDGIRTVEDLASKQERHFILPADVVKLINYYLDRSGGYYFVEVEHTIGPHDFQQVLDTVKNRLLDFILDLTETWNPKLPPDQEAVSSLVGIHIYNHAQGGNMTSVFDQRGQNVNYQFNAAGDINISEIRDKQSLVNEIAKLRLEIEKVKAANLVSPDTALEAEYHLLQAGKQAEQEKPNKGSILDHIGKAKNLFVDLTAAAGLVKALIEVGQLVEKLLP